MTRLWSIVQRWRRQGNIYWCPLLKTFCKVINVRSIILLWHTSRYHLYRIVVTEYDRNSVSRLFVIFYYFIIKPLSFIFIYLATPQCNMGSMNRESMPPAPEVQSLKHWTAWEVPISIFNQLHIQHIHMVRNSKSSCFLWMPFHNGI